MNRQLLSDVLTRQQHQVTCAANGVEALDLLAHQTFDVVLMDQMPVMDGLEATRRLRKLDGPMARVPVIGLTAGILSTEERNCLEAGMERCLAKPFAWPELFTVMAQLTSRQRSAENPIGAASHPESAPMFDRLGVSLKVEAEPDPLLQQVIDEAERSCARLTTTAVDQEEFLQDIHALKGTSGLFGLQRIRVAAGEIQEAARSGGCPTELMERLMVAVATTRAELQAHGVIAAKPGMPASAAEIQA